ncbi:hypothetical protein HKD37_09G025128 [Glycine soja]
MEVHMSSGGVDPPRDSLTSSTSSSSSVSILVRSPDVAPIQSPPPTEARQSSCHVNARGPSLEPTPTPSPSSIDARGPSPVEAKAATLSIRQQFGQPWPTWGAIPKDHHELFPSILSQMSLVDQYIWMRFFSKLIYERILEEFEARLSQARSDVALSVGESQLTPLDPDEEQRLRSRC